jgi:hypothetical protein
MSCKWSGLCDRLQIWTHGIHGEHEINASFMETSEFRHGPAEILDGHKPVMVFLVGTDESRD